MFAKLLVWLTVLGLVVASLLFTLYAYNRAGLLAQSDLASVTSSFNEKAGSSVSVELPSNLQKTNADEEERWKIVAYIMTAVTLLITVLVVALRKRIKVRSTSTNDQLILTMRFL